MLPVLEMIRAAFWTSKDGKRNAIRGACGTGSVKRFLYVTSLNLLFSNLHRGQIGNFHTCTVASLYAETIRLPSGDQELRNTDPERPE